MKIKIESEFNIWHLLCHDCELHIIDEYHLEKKINELIEDITDWADMFQIENKGEYGRSWNLLKYNEKSGDYDIPMTSERIYTEAEARKLLPKKICKTLDKINKYNKIVMKNSYPFNDNMDRT